MISDCIHKIERNLEQDANITEAYACFVSLIQTEMKNKLKCIQTGQRNVKPHKSRSKPFWNTELQESWDQVHRAEKEWLKYQGATPTKCRFRQKYCYLRRNFDKMLRKAKRRYQLAEQQSLRDKLFNIENPRDFWTEIGKLGMSNDRKSRIPFEVLDQNSIKTDKNSVLNRWKCDHAFSSGRVPSEWSKGIIKPLPKGEDLRNPLNYRPITIISIPCKIYANLLNRRLLKWLESNELLADEQNGFRRDRSCQDHIYALNSLIYNRKLNKKDTYACFVDCRKAFDTVNRDCLWFKLMSLGVQGKILQAIQSLYVDVTCSVRINEYFTDFFPVTQGLKQGCGLSPTLFLIYVNDLVTEINALNCGIRFDNNVISILMYADDIVLISESTDELQIMLNSLNSWCCKWRLAINESKTKVIHLRNKNTLQTDYVFNCGENAIVCVSEYKYLRFWFNEHLDMEKSVTEVTKVAGRALGAVYMKYLYAGGMSYEVYTKLIESVVEPVLFYCSGIWGTRKFPKVQRVLNKACRYFLGVSKNAPNTASRGDMGWVSAEVKQKIECVRLWCRLKTMPEDRTAHKVHQWSFSMRRSWENSMLKQINELDLQCMLAPVPNKTLCLKQAREKLNQIDRQHWEDSLLCNGRDESNGNKLRTYRTYKITLSTEFYVNSNMRRDHRRILARFRSCNLPLAIETGRFTKPKTPLNERLCGFCEASVIEDETHLLL